MTETSNNTGLCEFGPFQLDTQRRVLLRAGEPVQLPPKAVDMLIVLVENCGQVLEKDRLMQILWPHTIVEEANLALNVSLLRKALGESPSERKYIVTLPGKGYKFAAEVRRSGPADLVDLRSNSLNGGGETADREAPIATSIATSPSYHRTTSFTKHLWIGLCVMAAIGLTYWIYSGSSKSTERSLVTSLAVLPFAALTDKSDELLGIGMADVLITRLSNLRSVTVRPSSAVLKYSTASRSAIEIGKQLGVDSVLEGSLQRADGRMRVTARLISVADGASLWADSFDTAASDVFSVEDTISESVALRLSNRIHPEERLALTRRVSGNPEAHALYVRGRYQLDKRTPDSCRRALDYFSEVVRLDPKSALSYVGLAESYLSLSVTGVTPPREAFPKIKQAASRALEIDPHLADAHTMLGVAKFWHDWDFQGAERDFKRALELNPNLDGAHQMYGHLLSNLGRHDEALIEINRALHINPMSLIENALKGQMLNFAGRYDEAIAHLTKIIEVESNFWIFRLVLAKALERNGHYSRSIAELETAWVLSGHSPEPKSYLGYVFGITNNRVKALEAASELKKMSATRYVAPKHIALVYAGLGEKDQMFEWLEKAFEDRDISLTFIRVEQRWNPFRSDPRFIDLTRRIGL